MITIKRFGVITYSNCAMRTDIIFNSIAHKHLFWRFWCPIKNTKSKNYEV
jgi:hypothetical protein